MNKKYSHHGVFVLVLASFFFSLNTTFNRLVPSNVGTFYQLLIRTILMSSIFFAAGLAFKDLSKIKNKDWPLFIFRGLLFIGDFGSFFIAANHLPLGTTLFLFYAASILTSYLYGSFMLHEKLDKVKIMSLIFAFAGLVIIYSGNFSALRNYAILFALLSGACFGLETSTSKSLSDTYSINQVNMVAYITAAALSIPLLFFNRETITFTLSLGSWLIFLLFAVIGVLCFYTTLYGFKYVEAQKASLLLLGELVFIILIGFLFYHEVPTVITAIGGLLIIFALALPNLPLSILREHEALG